MIRLGRYKHYKGKEYQVLGEGIHTESEEVLVLYRPLYGDSVERDKIYIRPKEMFLERVLLKNKGVDRFEFVEEVEVE